MILEACLNLVASTGISGLGGTVAAVTPQNWLFLGAYKGVRREILERFSMNLVARLGEHSFSSNQAAGAFTALVIISATPPGREHDVAGMDVSKYPDRESKGEQLSHGELTYLGQERMSDNPDRRIAIENLRPGAMLSVLARGLAGMQTGDVNRFTRSLWELQCWNGAWELLQGPPQSTAEYTGRSTIVRWGEDGQSRPHGPATRIQGVTAWDRPGVAVGQMRELPATIYTGEMFDISTAVILPEDLAALPAVWAFCSSQEFNESVRKIDPKLNVTNATLVKVPFDLERWQKVAEERYPDGLPEPYSSDPTQWLFDGTVPGSDHPLQVAMARLLGYHWPDQVEDGLDDLADPDGIVCLPSVYREPAAHIRLRQVLERAYGDAWSSELLGRQLAEVEAESLEAWLRDRKGFFAQHVKLFHNRPFLWQITDGRKDGFSAIVNYHRLTPEVFRKLVYTYLDDWIGRQRHAVDQGEAGAQGRLDAATVLRQKLLAIYEGEPPYDIYVRWKSLAEQPIGWEPDLNDGVRLNIRPFIEAGVLASKVTVSWKKDRGKDPVIRDERLLAETTDRDLRERIELHASVDRHNDLHFTRAEKERARALSKAAEEHVEG